MDADIDPNTIVVNDFCAFFDAQPAIKQVLFNGQASLKTFKRHVGLKLLESRAISHGVMPSTSPAYAAMPFEEKYRLWEQGLLAPSREP